MNTELQDVVVRLREIMHMLDERGQPWAASAVNEAIEELAPSLELLPTDEDSIH